jgi:hypothetical protein
LEVQRLPSVFDGISTIIFKNHRIEIGTDSNFAFVKLIGFTKIKNSNQWMVGSALRKVVDVSDAF